MVSSKKLLQPYRNTKVKVRSPDGDMDFFNIVPRVLKGNTLVSVYNLPRLRTSNVDRSNKRKWLYTIKGKK